MSNYSEEVYLAGMASFRGNLRIVSACRAQLAHLSACGVPDGTVMHSEPVRRHTLKDGTVRVYQYTNELLHIGGEIFHVSRKRRYPEGRFLRDPNDPHNPDCHLLLLERLLLRMRLKGELKLALSEAKRDCKHLNASRGRKIKRICFEEELAAFYGDFQQSDEYRHLIAKIERQIGIERGPIIDTPELELKYCSFSNEIYSDYDERVRSKNELIVAKCARECGISYETEPFYPGTTKRADFVLHLGGRDVYLEILGWMHDGDYRARFEEKRLIAKQHRIPLAAIDMTDYPDASGRPVTRLYYDKLKRILHKLSMGLLPKGIAHAY